MLDVILKSLIRTTELSNSSNEGPLGVCVFVFLASGYRWGTVMHEIPISSFPILLTSLPYPRTQQYYSSSAPREGAVHMRRFQRARSILVMGLRGSCWWAAPQPRLLPRPSLQELVKEGRHMSALHPQLRTALKNGVMRSSLLGNQWPQQHTWLEGAGQSRKLVPSMYGGNA